MFETLGLSERKPTPDEQFDAPERMEIAGKEVEMYDIKPETLEDETPAIFGLGWTSTPESYRENILGLAGKGRRVISPNVPHGVELDGLKQEAANYPAAELRKVAAIYETMDKLEIGKSDVVAHSEACIFSVIAASIHPEKFRNLVLVNPPLIGEDNVRRLSVEFSMDIVKQTIDGLRGKHSQEQNMLTSLKTLASDPLRSIQEVFAIAGTDIRSMLEDLKSKGIGLAVIHSTGDKAFPMARMQEAVDSKMVDGFYSIEGTHNEILLNPEKVNIAINSALKNLAEKRMEQQPA